MSIYVVDEHTYLGIEYRLKDQITGKCICDIL